MIKQTADTRRLKQKFRKEVQTHKSWRTIVPGNKFTKLNLTVSRVSFPNLGGSSSGASCKAARLLRKARVEVNRLKAALQRQGRFERTKEAPDVAPYLWNTYMLHDHKISKFCVF